ncbi:MAG: cache domain-containing protein [Treponema sp.]
MKKLFSIRKKLVITFSVLLTLAVGIQGILGGTIAKRAILEKVEAHLTDKAADTAQVIDSKVMVFLSFIESVSRSSILRDLTIPYPIKIEHLKKEAQFNPRISELNITDINGNCYVFDGRVIDVSDREWFQTARAGKMFVSEQYTSRTDNSVINTLSMPVYDYDNTIIGVLSADTYGTSLSEDIQHITVGQTGYCFILGLTGNTIAHKNMDLVLKRDNFQENAKTDTSFTSLAQFAQTAMKETASSAGYYTFRGVKNIASYATIPSTGWKVIVRAPVSEFLGALYTLQLWMVITGISLALITILLIGLVSYNIVRPLQSAVDALKDIAQGEGDLTVRLKLTSNDEVTLLSEYFNQTIEKIGTSIKAVEEDANTMQHIGGTLAGNMSETAASVYHISENIRSVQEKTLHQSRSLGETGATVEEIIRTIKQLNERIEAQASSVAESSSAIEEMAANIASITDTLEKTDDVVKELVSATSDGKETLVASNGITHKIAEESGSLLEASSVIQHIASQTNLLAMNAAIEAAHAGEAGKGFAVVADEIRKLAEESSAQGKTITITLKNLSTEIEMLSASAKTVEDKFNTIFKLSEQVKIMSNRLTEAMQEQENGSQEVLIAIRNINSITVEVNEKSAEMLRGGEQVAHEMRTLDDITAVITGSMNDMAAGAVEINNAIQEVNDITQQTRQSIGNLVSEVQKFKV